MAKRNYTDLGYLESQTKQPIPLRQGSGHFNQNDPKKIFAPEPLTQITPDPKDRLITDVGTPLVSPKPEATRPPTTYDWNKATQEAIAKVKGFGKEPMLNTIIESKPSLPSYMETGPIEFDPRALNQVNRFSEAAGQNLNEATSLAKQRLAAELSSTGTSPLAAIASYGGAMNALGGVQSALGKQAQQAQETIPSAVRAVEHGDIVKNFEQKANIEDRSAIRKIMDSPLTPIAMEHTKAQTKELQEMLAPKRLEMVAKALKEQRAADALKPEQLTPEQKMIQGIIAKNPEMGVYYTKLEAAKRSGNGIPIKAPTFYKDKNGKQVPINIAPVIDPADKDVVVQWINQLHKGGEKAEVAARALRQLGVAIPVSALQ